MEGGMEGEEGGRKEGEKRCWEGGKGGGGDRREA